MVPRSLLLAHAFCLAVLFAFSSAQQAPLRILHALPTQPTLSISFVWSNGSQTLICASISFGKLCLAPSLSYGTTVQVVATSSSHAVVVKTNFTVSHNGSTLAIAPTIPGSHSQTSAFSFTDSLQPVLSSSCGVTWINLINGTVTMEDASFDIFVDDLSYAHASGVNSEYAGGNYGFLIAGNNLIKTGITKLTAGDQYSLFVIGDLTGSVKPQVAVVTLT